MYNKDFLVHIVGPHLTLKEKHRLSRMCRRTYALLSTHDVSLALARRLSVIPNIERHDIMTALIRSGRMDCVRHVWSLDPTHDVVHALELVSDLGQRHVLRFFTNMLAAGDAHRAVLECVRTLLVNGHEDVALSIVENEGGEWFSDSTYAHVMSFGVIMTYWLMSIGVGSIKFETAIRQRHFDGRYSRESLDEQTITRVACREEWDEQLMLNYWNKIGSEATRRAALFSLRCRFDVPDVEHRKQFISSLALPLQK